MFNVGFRFLLKKKAELNTSHSSARLLEEVLAIERDEDNRLVHCTKVDNNSIYSSIYWMNKLNILTFKNL